MKTVDLNKKNYWIEKIKIYFDKANHDQEYLDLITNNPEVIFDSINEERFIMWGTKLYNFNSIMETHLDSDILTVPQDRFDQNTIKKDCNRTRVRESVLIPGFKVILEQIITFYCNKKKLQYKQGLNEIFGPLLLLKYKLKRLKISNILNFAETFIDKYLPNYFVEKDFAAFYSSLNLFRILFQYHEPSVYNSLNNKNILPQMYATNWILTLLSGKCKIGVLYQLWDHIIQANDPLFLHFIMVALIQYNREMVINCEETMRPGLMSTLNISSTDELERIIQIALSLRTKTPYSFRILANKIGFLKSDNSELSENYLKYKPETITAMPIFPLEIFFITYKSEIPCPDEECETTINFLKKGKEEPKPKAFYLIEQKPKHICEYCDMKIYKNINYVLLDLRIEQKEKEKGEESIKNDNSAIVYNSCGLLPMMVCLPQDELKSEDLSEEYTDRFVKDRGNYHFIFLTTKTDSFSEFENQFYKENLTEDDKIKMRFGLIKEKKAEKELVLENAQKNLNLKDIYKLKEYDNLKNTLRSMQKQNFPYICYAYGGYSSIHEKSFIYDIQLLFHDNEKCSLCKMKLHKHHHKEDNDNIEENNIITTNELWKQNEKIKYCDLNKVITNTNSFICMLIQHKQKKFKENEVEVLIAFLYDTFNLEILKFNRKNILSTKDLPGLSQKSSKTREKFYDLGKENEKEEKELTILEKLNIDDILNINPDPKSKNVLWFKIKDKDIKKTKKNKKNNDDINNSYTIIMDFLSFRDSKKFIQMFKSFNIDYKNKLLNKEIAPNL